MRLSRDGEIVEPVTKIGEFDFHDPNGKATVRVEVDGYFWREITIEGFKSGRAESICAGSAKTARKLARLLLKAADAAQREERRLNRPR